MMHRITLFILCLWAPISFGIPLDSWQTWSVAQPYVSKQVPPGAMIVRGSGTDSYYVLEADPTTGAIPVDATVVFPPGTQIEVTNFPATVDTNYGTPTSSTIREAAMLGVGSTAVSNSNPVPISDAGGSITVDGTVTANQGGSWTVAATQSGTWTVQPGNTANTTPWLFTINQGGNSATVSAGGALKVDASGSTQPVSGTVAVSNLPSTVDTNLGAPGASTLRTAAMLGVGSTAVSNANPVPISDAGGTITVDGTVAVSNFPSTVDTNAGAASASTIRVSAASRTYADSVNQDYGSGNVTTGAWTQLLASTAAAINLLCITDTSGQVMELGTGSAASETRVFLIAQGFSGCIPLRIAASTRLSVRAVTATANSGYLTISGMN